MMGLLLFVKKEIKIIKKTTYSLLSPLIEAAGKFGGLAYIIWEATYGDLELKDIAIGMGSYLVGCIAARYNELETINRFADFVSESRDLKRDMRRERLSD